MVINIIRYYHDDMAHCGIERTIQGIIQNYWFPTLRKKVKDYVNNCIVCIVSNTSKNLREGKMQIIDIPNLPFKIIHCDHFDLLLETKEGYKHILILVAFIKFTWLFPVKSTGSKEAIKHMFTSSEFKEFIISRNITYRQVAVAAPWANGIVERVNRF